MKRCPLMFTLVLLAVLSLTMASAQDGCPAIVQTALDTIDSACRNQTGRNQICYGNRLVEVEPQAEAAPFAFESPGDVVDITSIQSLRLSGMDVDAQVWGMSLMRFQANLPNTLPGQHVTFLLFGDVTFEHASGEAVQLPVTATSGLNVRSGPSTNYAVVDGLLAGQTVTADGRLEDGSWLHVRLLDGNMGWVYAQLVTSDEALNTLAVMSDERADTFPGFGPMQAFTFSTGIGDSPCEEAPDSGILIHTPAGQGTMSFRVNEVNIELGSTAYLTAAADQSLMVNVLKGEAQVESFEETQTVPAGDFVAVPVDDDLVASGPPSEPAPYDERVQRVEPLTRTFCASHYDVPTCSTVFGDMLCPGDVITFGGGTNGFSRDEVETRLADYTVEYTVDGEELDEVMVEFWCNGNCAKQSFAPWLVTVGTHTVSSEWNGPEAPVGRCVFTVE